MSQPPQKQNGSHNIDFAQEDTPGWNHLSNELALHAKCKDNEQQQPAAGSTRMRSCGTHQLIPSASGFRCTIRPQISARPFEAFPQVLFM